MANFLIYSCITAIACLSFSIQLGAKDFGNYGRTVPIAEESLLDYLQQRVDSLFKGDNESLFARMQEQAVYAAHHPKSVHLPRAQKSRSFTYDPTITVKRNILDHKGQIIALKGTRLNPLTVVSLSRPLCFFDASDPDQISWARKQQGKWILTAGSPIELEEDEQVPVYFDQKAELTSLFAIEALPALVTQSGVLLLIEEIYLQEGT